MRALALLGLGLAGLVVAGRARASAEAPAGLGLGRPADPSPVWERAGDAVTAMQPRGIRNNNPFNLRPGSPWQGLDTPAVDDGNYLRFKDPRSGIRAGTINLINQQKKHGLRTVRAIISKYAPPSENNTEAYIRAVSKALGVTDTEVIDLFNLATLTKFVRAIIRHENGPGEWYAEVVLQAGINAGRSALA